MRVRRMLGLLTVGLVPLSLSTATHAAGASHAMTTAGSETATPFAADHNASDFLAEVSISANGRFIAFTSKDSTLVPGDTNGVADVFVRDVKTRRTVLVSGPGTGVPASTPSISPSISDDGRYVAFVSRRLLWVDGNIVTPSDLFVRDIVAGTTTRVAMPAVPSISFIDYPALSGNGRFVTYAVRADFAPDTAYLHSQIYRTELATGSVSLVSATSAGVMGDDGSYDPAITDDGNLIAFASAAPNLSPTYDGAFDILLKNMTTGTVRHVGENHYGGSPGGAPPIRSAISGRGGDLAYERFGWYDDYDLPYRRPVIATDLIRGGERELGLTADTTVSGSATHPSLSEHGIDLVYDSDSPDLVANDPDGTAPDVFLTDLRPGGVTTLLVANAESPAISDSGRYVAYVTYADRMAHIWRRDVHSGATRRVDLP